MPNQRRFDEFHRIRQELHALREDFEKQGQAMPFNVRVNELEIEDRPQQIYSEIEEGRKSKKKDRRWLERRLRP